jgi:GDP-4-dehydro-6-deoxy-D-mannose reductase
VRVLITGVEGFVGGHLAHALAARGHEVWGTSLEDPPGGSPRRMRCDVRDLAALRRALSESGAEAIAHLAARSSVVESLREPLETYETNVGGAVNVLEASRLAGLEGPILLVGSGESYGDQGAGAPLDEDAPLRPLSAYAAAKAAQELIGAQYARAYGLRVVSTRSFAHTGPGQEPRFALAGFARQLAALGRSGGSGELRAGNLTPVRDYLDVRDVVAAYALLLERGERGAVRNVCSGQGFALREYLDELIEIAGVEVEVRQDPALVREIEIERLVGDPGALLADGWRPAIAKHDMLTDLLGYWSERT